ncbi:hypothetical protein SAMN05660642_03859 [Geodermatophilus siccatus]|uniref:Secreted protein n=1 Tax=Geodermatophilus siccatus TaxID=1137991 RepID=A0A1G9Y237_9ACTN|nr:hypothetical protein [Geodermatophilus siccatus]SDN03118.1 hypothetical protein SAMN05660642_03859 [Geodermatophilus siccatus]
MKTRLLVLVVALFAAMTGTAAADPPVPQGEQRDASLCRDGGFAVLRPVLDGVIIGPNFTDQRSCVQHVAHGGALAAVFTVQQDVVTLDNGCELTPTIGLDQQNVMSTGQVVDFTWRIDGKVVSSGTFLFTEEPQTLQSQFIPFGSIGELMVEGFPLISFNPVTHCGG